MCQYPLKIQKEGLFQGGININIPLNPRSRKHIIVSSTSN